MMMCGASAAADIVFSADTGGKRAADAATTHSSSDAPRCILAAAATGRGGEGPPLVVRGAVVVVAPGLLAARRGRGSAILHTQEIGAVCMTSTVLFPCSETSNFFLLRFALGPAVLETEFRADHESGLRIEQSLSGQYESSV
jgi:hypothetical protein